MFFFIIFSKVMNLLLFGVKIMKIKAKYFGIGVVSFPFFPVQMGLKKL